MSVELVDCIVSFIGLCIAIFGVYSFFYDRKRNSKKNTLDAYEVLQKETFDRINIWKPSEIKQVCEDRQSQEYKELSGYLSNIERFCVGINEKIYDFETFYKIAHGYFDDERGLLKRRILPLLESKLEISKEDYFSNIHEVWKKMENRSRKLKKSD